MKLFGIAVLITMSFTPVAHASEESPWSNMPDLKRLVEKQQRQKGSMRQLATSLGQNCDETSEARGPVVGSSVGPGAESGKARASGAR